MGINFGSAALLAKARWRHGVDFTHALTIGRLNLNMSQSEAERLLDNYRSDVRTAFAVETFADDYLRLLLNAERITSLDYSDYEGCDILHDLNTPIPPELHQQFNAVIDGGCLEHIFNVPVALANYMNLVRQGGSLFICTIANNQMGHGFYQFSPELFYRVLSSANGFEVRDVILVRHPFPSAELSTRMKFFSVVDPARIGHRVGLVSGSPIEIMVHAVRVSADPVPPLRAIQSDYAAVYDGRERASVRRQREAGLTAALRAGSRSLPRWSRQLVTGAAELYRHSFYNRRSFQRWSPL